MHGSLLCISLDGFFEEPVWAVVEKHFADERFVTKRGVFFSKQLYLLTPHVLCEVNQLFCNKVRTGYIITTIKHKNRKKE